MNCFRRNENDCWVGVFGSSFGVGRIDRYRGIEPRKFVPLDQNALSNVVTAMIAAAFFLSDFGLRGPISKLG